MKQANLFKNQMINAPTPSTATGLNPLNAMNPNSKKNNFFLIFNSFERNDAS